FHEVIHPDDPRWIFERGGIEAAIQAREEGKIRFIGFSGHKDPSIHLHMLERFPWDAVLMPLNVLDAHFRSFEHRVLPEVVRLGMAPLAMKSLGGDGIIPRMTGIPVRDCLRYTLSLPVSVLISGIDSLEVLQENLAVVRDFKPMDEEEKASIRLRSAPFARDGRYEEYKTADSYDGDPGRRAHGLE
ncbi:MAG: aldo/keto reductase, partial [Bacteroidota bacterium]